MAKKDFTEKNFVLNHLTDKEKEYAENYNNPKKIHVSKTRLLISNMAFIAGVITILGALFTAYSFAQKQGARDSEIDNLLDEKNPVVKRLELKNEISSVRHDMAVGDTLVTLKNSSNYILSNQHMESIDKSILEIKKDNKTNMTLIIGLLKSQGNTNK